MCTIRLGAEVTHFVVGTSAKCEAAFCLILFSFVLFYLSLVYLRLSFLYRAIHNFSVLYLVSQSVYMQSI